MTEQQAKRHHSLDYVEIPATDLKAAKAFYGAAFGWSFNDYGPGPAYVGIRRPGSEDPGDEIGGFRPEEKIAPGGPLLLLWSDDLEASVAAVRSAGGTILQDPYAFPGGRRFHFGDPSGNELGVWSTG